MMFFLISGAAASGKTTMAQRLPVLVSNIECHDSDELFAADNVTRWRNLEIWVQRALEAQAAGLDYLVAGHSPLGELLTCPSSIQLNGIAACLLDCADPARIERHRVRGIDPRWPPNQDTINWAAWHRMHADDPQWEQHVIIHACPFPEYLDRWRSWTRDDPRWRVPTIDTTHLTVDESIAQVANWMSATRGQPASLAPASRWWARDVQ